MIGPPYETSDFFMTEQNIKTLTREQARQKSARDGVYYIDRDSRELCEELVFGRGFVEFFYENSFGRFLTHTFLIRRLFSQIYGWYNDSRLSRRKIPGFISSLSIPLDEVLGGPEEHSSFNDFFARKLKPECRPFDSNPKVLISPADARLAVFEKISGDTLLPIKGAKIPVDNLLADKAMGARYHNGGAMILRLCPSDYHRFHFPATGVPGPPLSIPGVYHSVSPFALEKGIDVFCKNHRVVTEMDTERFGKIALIDVGALCVGAIVSTFEAGKKVNRGAEKGYFKFGGSTIVLLTQKDRVQFDEDLLSNTADGFETLIQMGHRLGISRD
jgi:phosphatidylserine decarboxylase